MVELYIAGQPVELDETVSFTINRYFEDTTNPTSIYSEWSKTVTIPRTLHNNKLFGSLYCPDRLIAYSSGNSNLGLYFDPYKRLDMRLERNGTIIMKGYLKVLTVSNNGYECTLNGELGNIFKELQKITFDETKYEGDEKTKYWIDGSKYFKGSVDKSLVYECWTANGQHTLDLQTVDNPDYEANDIIGFTPNNSFVDGFDYKTFQTAYNESKSFQEVLEGTDFVQKTKMNVDAVIGDGITPRAIGEFRSYLQLPFVYWNKLWKIFQKQAEKATGYKWQYNDPIFSTDLFNVTAYRLKCLGTDLFASKNNYYPLKANTVQIHNWTTKTGYSTVYTNAITSGTPSEEVAIYDNGTFNMVRDGALNLHFEFRLTDFYNESTNIADGNALLIDFVATSESGTTLTKTAFVCNKNTNTANPKYSRIVMDDFSGQTGQSRFSKIIWDDYMFLPVSFGKKITFSIKTRWNTDSFPLNGTPADDTLISVRLDLPTCTNTSNLRIFDRDLSSITLNDFWDNSYNPFTAILNYCKQMRILIQADDVNKKLIFVQQANYFKNYTISSWDDKIDKTQDFIITPITWDKKYILFNYKENGTTLEEEYKKKYKFKPGEKNIITQYVFNDDTTELFTNLPYDILQTDYTLSWTSLYDDKEIVYTLPLEWELSAKNGNKFKDNFGSMFFVSKQLWDKSEPMRQVYISDDTLMQLYNQKYFYSQRADQEKIISVGSYERPDMVKNGILCLFNKPAVSYTSDNDYYNNCKSIYDLYWKNYLDERYNVQNKKVTCYVKLTQTDYNSFQFNHFVTIDNQLYMVNKIFDYDPEVELTKVELITISNIKGYTS